MALTPTPVVLQDLVDNTSDINAFNNGVKTQAVSPRTLDPQVVVVQVQDDPLSPAVATGNADTNTVNKCEDSGATFVTDGVEVGDAVLNTTDDTSAIATVVTETAITFATDIFPLGTEAYKVIKPAYWTQKNGLGEWKRSGIKHSRNPRVTYPLPTTGTVSSIVVHEVVYPVATPEDTGFYPPATNA